MTSLSISAAVDSIDPAFFQLFPNATSITVAEDNESYASHNGMVFSKDLTNLLLVPEGLEGNAVLPASLATVPACVFSRCTKLSAIVATAYAGGAATSAFASQDGILYTNDKATLVAAPAGIGASATIAAECTTIAAGAFWGSANLKTIVSNAVVEDIATAQGLDAQDSDAAALVPAFNDEAIANATVVLNVPDDDGDAAKQAWEAAGFAVFAEAAQSGSVAGPEEGQSGIAFTLQDDNTLAAWWSGSDAAPATVKIPATAEINGVIYTVASIAANGFQDQSGLEEVALPNGLTAIGEAAFAGSGLKRLSIPGSVVTIGEGALADCVALEVVELHEGTRTIADRAFGGTAIESITLPKSIQSIGASAFAGCQNLHTVLAMGSISDVAATALAECSGVSVYVPLRAEEDYGWSLGAPAVGNHLMPYGVQVTSEPIVLTEGEEADLFQDGYVEASGNIEVTYAYKQPVSVTDGTVTAKQSGTTPVTASLSLGDIQLAASSTPVTVNAVVQADNVDEGIASHANGYDPSTRLPIKVVFDAQDGTLPSALNGEFYNRVPGGTFTVPADTPTPTDSTYEFAYWILQGYGPIQPGDTISITESLATESATSGGYLYLNAHYMSGLRIILDPDGGYQPYATEFNEAYDGYPVVQGSRYPVAGKSGYSYIPIPIKPGYTFAGYYLNGTIWYQASQNRPDYVLRNFSGNDLPSGGTIYTLVARWTRDTSVPVFSLYPDGGEQSVSNLVATVYDTYYPVAPGNAIPCSSFADHSYLPIPTKDGYKFLGYFADGNEKPIFASGTPSEAGGREVLVCSAGYEFVTNDMLTARWAIDEQCLTLDPGEGAYQPVTTKIYEHDNYRLPIAVGDTMPIDGKPGYSRIPIPVKPGYTFNAYVCTGTGYRITDGTGGGFLYDANGNISTAIEQHLYYVAQWTKNNSASSVILNPGEGTQDLATEVYLLNLGGNNNYPVVPGDMFPVRGMPGFSYVPVPVKEGGLFTSYASSLGTAFLPGSYPDGDGLVLRTADSSLTSVDSIRGTWFAQYSTDLWELSYDCVIPGFYVQGNLSESYSYGIGDRTLPTPTNGAASGQSGNWKFVGWYDNPDYEGAAYADLPLYATGDKKFYAKWTAVATLRNDPSNASDAASYNTTVELVYGKAFPNVKVPDFPNEYNYGYTFRGYSDFNPQDVAIDGSSKPKLFTDGNGESANRIIDTANAPEVFYAYWSGRFDLYFAQNDIVPGSVTAIFLLLGAPAGIAFDNTGLGSNDLEYLLYCDFSDENIIGNQPNWMPKRNGYTFDGFSAFGGQNKYIDANGFSTGRYIAKAQPRAQLQARWIAAKYKITYETYGGAAVINSGQVDSYTYGVGATLPTDVSSEVISKGTVSSAPKFIGWSETDVRSSKNQWDYLKFVTEIPATATGDKTFYAVVGQEWEFDYRGGSGDLETFRRIVTKNGSETETTRVAPFPIKQDVSSLVAPNGGWEFAGMIFTNPVLGSMFSIVSTDGSHAAAWATGDEAIAYAFWVKDVSLDANGGEAGSVTTVKASYGHPLGYSSKATAPSSNSVYEIQTILPPTNKPSANEGWKPSNGSRPFLGYFTSPMRGQGQMVIDAEGNPTDVAYTFDQNTVYAQWGDVVNGSYTVKYYQQNLTGSGYTEVAADAISGTAEVGTTVTAPTKSYTGFTENTSHASRVPSGTVPATGTLTLKLYYDRSTYTVTYKVNGIVNGDRETVRYGAEVTVRDVPSREGYYYTPWSPTADSNVTISDGRFIMPANDVMLASTSRMITYTITYKPNYAGEEADQTVSLSYSSSHTVKPYDTFTRSGYDLVGWNTEADGSGVSYKADQIVSKLSSVQDGNIDLYAQWQKKAYTVTWHANDGHFGSTTSDTVRTTSDVEHGTTVASYTPQPIRDGYRFVGWAKSSTATSALSFPQTITATTDFYAVWKKTYTIAFNPNGGNWDGSMAVKSASYDEGAAVAKPADPAQTGKLFAGWSETRGGAAVEPIATATKDVTYYALWNDATASVVVRHYQQNVTGASYTLRETETPTATVGSTYTARAKTYTGFHENSSHANRVPSGTVPASGTLELALYYDRNTHGVTYQFNGTKPASATVPVDNTAHRYGATVTVKNPTTVAGWSFSGWSVKQGGVTLSSGSFQMGDVDVVLEGTWTAQASTIAFQTNGGSAVASRTGVTDQAITDRAMPTTTWTGHAFEGWFADASLAGDPVTQLPAAFPAGGVTYYAKWSVKTYDVKWNPNGGSWAEGGSAAKTTQVAHGQNVEVITEVPNAPENHAFGGWAASKADADAKVAVTFPVQNTGEPTVKEYFAIWNKDAVTYTVKYLDADGNQLQTAKSGSGEVDAQVTETAPTITGYTVVGDATKTITLKADATQNVIVFRYEAKTTVVTFDGHGGTGGMAGKGTTFTYAQPLPTIDAAEGMLMPAGKKLDGWFSEATGGTKYYEADGTVAASAPTTDGKWVGTGGSVPTSMTLHAQWSAKSYTIMFLAGEGSGSMDDLAVTYGDGAVFPACTFTAPENTQFAGWKIEGAVHAAGSAADAFDVADGMTLIAEAQWTRNGYTVTFDANGGTFGASDTVSQVYAPGTPITVPTVTRTGYLFDGWMVDGVHVDEVDATATRDVTFVAAWDQPSFLITFTGGAAGAKYAGAYQGGLPSFADADAAASHKDEVDYRFYNEELQAVQQWVQYGKAGQTLPKVLDLYKLTGASASNAWGSTIAAPGAGSWTGGMALGGTEGGAGDEHFTALYADGAGATLYAQFTPTIDVTVPTVVDMSLNVSGDTVSVSAASGGAATKFVSRSAGDVVINGISEGAAAGGSLAVQQGDYIANAVKILCADDGSAGLRDIMLTVAQAGQEGDAAEVALKFNLLSRGPASAVGAPIEVPAGQAVQVEYGLAGVDATKVTPSEPLKIANLIYQIAIKE